MYFVLPKTLNTGDKITISTPFRVKIPWLFSRMGYNGDLFSITQWYPKPAVYDVNGWNTFPYAEQGEYYIEFGDYTVSLNLSANWRIAATGELQDTAEFAWLDSLVLGGKVPILRLPCRFFTAIPLKISSLQIRVSNGMNMLPCA